MGVAPYSWPHNRQWQPGIYDKRSNLGMWFVLILYLLFFIGFTLNIGPRVLSSDLLPVFILLVILLGGIVALFLAGQTMRREVKVEEAKYFDVPPDRLSRLLADTLDLQGTRYRREGPKQAREDYWEDSFHLVGRGLDGISLTVERNPLIARVDKASVTVRGTTRALEAIEGMKDMVDGVVMRELLDRYEREMGAERPELVVWGEDGSDTLGPTTATGPGPHKPYDPPVP